jgi:hypothetical protein
MNWIGFSLENAKLSILSPSPLIISVLIAVFGISLVVDCVDGGVFLVRCQRGFGGAWKTYFFYTSATYIEA